MKILTSGDGAAVRTLFHLAHAQRSALGARWWRLLYLALLWAGLSILTPHYGHTPQDAARWRRWLQWLRARSLEEPASLTKIDPVGIAERVEALERGRWVREFAREGGRYSRTLEGRSSTGLNWTFLENEFAWLLRDEESSTPIYDAVTDRDRRTLVLSLWSFELWLKHRERDRRDDNAVPSSLGYKILATLARMVGESAPDSAQELWEPVLRLGAPAHYAVGHFLSCWFLEVRGDATAFALRWTPMIEYALSSSEWGDGRPWFYGQRLLRQIIGCGSETVFNRSGGYQNIVFQMRHLYEKWAREHLAREEENVAALSAFAGSSTGRLLRVDALQWLHQALSGESPAASWYRSFTGNALVEFLNVVLTEDVGAVSSNVNARSALLDLVLLLITKQVPAALALQERARRSL
jgi:hypothetical protein